METYSVRAVGHIRASRSDAVDDQWDSVTAWIELDPQVYSPDATAGLADFSHIEVLYLFHLVDEAGACTGARHPRSRADWPLTGILAQRAKDRPNRLGVTTCRLTGVEGLQLRVEGLDAIDGTPVLDIKPVMRGFLPRGTVSEPAWAAELMSGYW
jgi:tRNA (Thr-GGU) A37 N-methylase